ncbi:DUF6789 family protein [Halomicrobium katesii]|uniref:DUF6789 family protein n=1 Tax=Halomicrobium katesii TaxID=437163 RepID=UPI001FE157B8|nr:DUF6789 family protein [Halomicrobium katesii]
MADAPHGVDDPVDDPVDELSETEEFDSLIGIVGDGVVGAAGGLVGTALSTVVLLIAESLGVFERSAFALLTELVGIEELVPSILAGYLIFLAGGMVPWPLLYVSLKEYLPGRRDPVIRTVVGVNPVDRTTACGRSGKDLQLSVSAARSSGSRSGPASRWAFTPASPASRSSATPS